MVNLANQDRQGPRSSVACDTAARKAKEYDPSVVPRWARRVWPVAKYFIGLALAALAFYQLTGHKSELTEASAALSHLRWGWVLVGMAAEAGSYLAFAQLQRRFLRAGSVNVTLGPITAIALAATSIANSFPAGPVLSTLFSFRQYRRRGADQAVAGWSVAATFVSLSVALTVVAAVGAAVAGAEGASLDLIPPIVAALILALAMGLVFVQERAAVRIISAALHLSQRLIRWPHGELATHINRIIHRLTRVHLSPAQVGAAFALALANWLLDCGCLALSFLAVGAPVPWKGLLLAYGAGQLAANLPITPGGLGVVEGSLTIAIVAYGGAAGSTVVAVLLYRFISFWLILPIGWAAWGWLTWIARRRPLPMPASPVGAVEILASDDGRARPASHADAGTQASRGSGDGEGDVSEAAL
jgi:putative heme transporter